MTPKIEIEPAHRRRSLPACWLGAVLVLAFSASPSLAQLWVSPDVTVDLSGSPHPDESAPSLVNPLLQLDLGPLPDAAAVTAIAADSNGDVYFSLETTIRVAIGLVVGPRDVVVWDGSAYSIFLDGSTIPIPDDARIDALAFTERVIVSFNTTVALPGGLVVADEDLVEWDGAGFVAPIYFDGSMHGVGDGLDVDGAHFAEPDYLLLSFDSTGVVGKRSFTDEDVIAFDRASLSWLPFADASASEPAFAAADLDGVTVVPEPAQLALLLFGALHLMALRSWSVLTRSERACRSAKEIER